MERAAYTTSAEVYKAKCRSGHPAVDRREHDCYGLALHSSPFLMESTTMPAGLRFALVLVLISGLSEGTASRGQDAPGGQSAMSLPPVPKGVEVLARGPVHEAFATLTADPVATKAIVKAPPKALEELPPDQKPAS